MCLHGLALLSHLQVPPHPLFALLARRSSRLVQEEVGNNSLRSSEQPRSESGGQKSDLVFQKWPDSHGPALQWHQQLICPPFPHRFESPPAEAVAVSRLKCRSCHRRCRTATSNPATLRASRVCLPKGAKG